MKEQKGLYYIFLLILIILNSAISVHFSYANTPVSKTKEIIIQSIFDKMNYQEVLNVDLRLDMEEVFDDRRNTEKHNAVFSFTDEKGKTQKWDIKVSLRGKFRRTKCENLPPLRLDFKKKSLETAGLAEYDDMKLVTQCMNNKREAKQLLAKEYLAYKIYNQISDESYRVQFLKINYIDSKTGKKTKHFGFLIEDTAQLRARIDAEKVSKIYSLPKEAFHTNQVKTVAVFQYLIGNSDWSINISKNVKMLKQGDLNILIPYDFDFSGLVGASYSMVDSKLGITNPKQRVYLGFPDDMEDLDEIINLFISKKELIVKTINDTNLLTRGNKRVMLNYVFSFYEQSKQINLPSYIDKLSTFGE